MSNQRSYQSPEEKKEEFRKYLEKAGVVDVITKVLVGLYEEPEKPPNAVDYIKRYMGAPSGVDVNAIQGENQDLKKENLNLKDIIEKLSNENANLNKRLEEIELQR